MIEHPSYDEPVHFTRSSEPLLNAIQAEAAVHATDYEPTSPLGEPSHIPTKELLRELRRSGGSYTVPKQ